MARARRRSLKVQVDDSSSQSGIHSGSSRRKFVFQVAIVGVLVTALMTFLTCGIDLFGWTSGLEYESQERRFQEPLLRDPVTLHDDICFVEVDDAALEEFGPWPWPRQIQAEAVEEILRAGAAVVALDLKYHVPRQDPADDQALATALEVRIGDQEQVVVLAAQVAPDDMSRLGSRAVRETLFRSLVESGFPHRAEKQAEAAGLDPAQKRFLNENMSLALAMLLREQFAWKAGEKVEAGQEVELGDLDALIPGASEIKWLTEIRDRLWMNWEAWNAFVPANPEPPRDTIHPGVPIPILARAAGTAGMVDIAGDDSAAVRRVEVYRRGPLGRLPTLGIVAALEYQKRNDPQAGSWRIDEQNQELLFGSASDDPWAHLPIQRTNRGVDDTDPLTAPDSERWDLWIHWPDVGVEGIPEDRRKPIGQYVNLNRERRRLREGEDSLPAMQFKAVKFLQRTCPAIATLVERNELEELGLSHLDLRALDPKLVQLAEAEALRTLLDRKLQAVPEDIQDNFKHAMNAVAIWSLFGRARQELEGKIVFIGVSAGGNVDVVQTPLDPRTPGVHVHGVVADMVLQSRGIRVSAGAVAWVWAVILGLVVTFLTSWFGLRWSTIGSLSVILAYAFWSGPVSFENRVLAPLAAPLGTASAVLAACLIYAYRLTERERQQVTRHLKARVPNGVWALYEKNPEVLMHKGRKRVCTSLFIDIRGFTTISEKLTKSHGPERTVAVLNEVLGVISETLLEHQACVNKFLGDGAMAFWSPAQLEPEQERLSCEAALACQRRVKEMNNTPMFEGVDEISCRIGIATGPVVVGDVGSVASIRDYTVIGDSVNLAARLESANKIVGTDILINGATYRKIRGGPLRTRPIGRIQVVGQKRDVGIHQLLETSFPQEQEDVTRRAVEAFAHGDWDECQRMLERLERIERGHFGGDPKKYKPSGLIQMYRDEMQDREPEKGRIIVLQSK